jgi:divinyl chlorophyllide a 8-vinyl-reductase
MIDMPPRGNPVSKRVLLLGATGTIGQATRRALERAGHDVTCFIRPRAGVAGRFTEDDSARLLAGAELRFGDVTDPLSFRRDGLRDEPFDVIVSCLGSRTGASKDAWAIDYQAHVQALAAAKDAGVAQMVLLSALCVQKPRLDFQRAKLAFEQELIGSGLTYSIVRPTAFFKSLSGQVERLKQGKPFLVFGDGRQTACKPISDDDLGDYLTACVTDERLQNRILPIGGPGKAITPIDQGEHLFSLLCREPRFRHVPTALLDGIIGALNLMGHVVPALSAKADLARIGRYYATESMLVLDEKTGCYDEDATPSFGSETLFDYYERLLKGETTLERGDHAVF